MPEQEGLRIVVTASQLAAVPVRGTPEQPSLATGALDNLLGAYFHQDYDLIADTLDGLLDDFVAHTAPAEVEDVLRDVDRFRHNHSAALSQAFHHAFPNALLIGSTEQEAACWFDWLRTGLRTRLARQQ